MSFLSDFRATWKDKPLSATKKLEQLRGVCKFALARKWIPDNPALALAMPQVKPNPTLPFSDEEMERILKAADSPTGAGFHSHDALRGITDFGCCKTLSRQSHWE